MSKFILGIDAGGTKTHGTLVDTAGTIVATTSQGGANWERVGVPAATAVLDSVISDLLAQVSGKQSDVGAATLAVAGIDWPEDLLLFSQFLSGLNISGNVALINDSFGALYAGAPNGTGIVSIAGTGGKTAGCNGALTVQTMGMEVGEGGGGGQLISLAVDKVAYHYHAGLTSTPLAQLVLKTSGKNSLLDFFYAVSRENLSIDESLAPSIFELATIGDIDSVDIVARVAHQHAMDVIAISKRLDYVGEIPVVRSGGLHTAGNHIFDQSFQSILDSSPFHFEVKTLDISPSFGSVIHASHSYFDGVNTQFIETLLSQARERAHL
jgi:N-acetylglucosamine kinase-like BadF-type ATPase